MSHDWVQRPPAGGGGGGREELLSPAVLHAAEASGKDASVKNQQASQIHLSDTTDQPTNRDGLVL